MMTIVWRYWHDATGHDHRVVRQMTVRELKEDIAFIMSHHPDRMDLYQWCFHGPHRLLANRQTLAGAGIHERDFILVKILPFSEARMRVPLG